MSDTFFRTTRVMNLRGGPGTNHSVIRLLGSGEVLSLRDAATAGAAWLAVTTADGTAGFASRSLLEEVVAGAKVEATDIDLSAWRDPDRKLRDTAVLHPAFRKRALSLVSRLDAEGISFGIFEAWRSPWRQTHLFAQGRTRPGSIVTNARAWESYHQYGLAADFVLTPFGANSWDSGGPKRRLWDRLREIGRAEGLEDLSFERPHFQLAGLKIADLRAGRLPAGGDDPWQRTLNAVIAAWDGEPTAPPPITDAT